MSAAIVMTVVFLFIMFIFYVFVAPSVEDPDIFFQKPRRKTRYDMELEESMKENEKIEKRYQEWKAIVVDKDLENDIHSNISIEDRLKMSREICPCFPDDQRRCYNSTLLALMAVKGKLPEAVVDNWAFGGISFDEDPDQSDELYDAWYDFVGWIDERLRENGVHRSLYFQPGLSLMNNEKQIPYEEAREFCKSHAGRFVWFPQIRKVNIRQ